MKKLTCATALALGVVSATPASAEMLWSTFSLSYLKGGHYAVGDDNRQVVTVEHTSSHTWGDNFLFIDRSMSQDGTTKTYGELSPRLSLGKISGKDFSFGPVKDVLLAGTWEAGDKFDNFLYGVGFAVNVPGFKYFNVNLYRAQNELWENDNQLTLTWGLPFSVGNQDFLIDGFMDWSNGSSDHSMEMNFTPQIKWNAGKLFGMKTPLYVGMEYAYWNNKYGIKGADERSPSLLIKWHF